MTPAYTVLTDGIFRTPDHGYFDHGRGPITSVTTAMKMYDKSDALVGWAKKETASFAVRHREELVRHWSHEGPDPECPACAKTKAMYSKEESARLWISSIVDYKRDSAADLGTRVHAAAERLAQGHADEVEDEVLPFARQYRRFMDEREPTYLAIEYLGVNRTHDYAGTGDIIAGIDGLTWVIDIKTHTKDTPLPKTYYPETGMQLAACANFEVIGRTSEDLGNDCVIARDMVTPPRIERHGVLLVGREDYRLIPYAVTDLTFGAFLDCLALYAWKYGEGKTIVGAA